jgi:hypothetical protein
MKTLLAFRIAASLGLSGCYTQLYTQGYASRALAPPGYAREPQTQADTLSPGDSALSEGERDSVVHSTVVVNNYYRESPYYRGYLVDEWEYPTISLGFYSSRYRDYNGAYWWNNPGYYRPSHRVYRGGNYQGSYPSSGGGTAGPYTSDKRLYSNPPRHVAKGHRSASGNTAPAPKQAAENSAPKTEVAPANPQAAPASDNGGSPGSNKNDSDPEDQDQKPAKGRRR